MPAFCWRIFGNSPYGWSFYHPSLFEVLSIAKGEIINRFNAFGLWRKVFPPEVIYFLNTVDFCCYT